MQSVEQGGVGVSSVGADSELDLRALGAALWRKKWLVLIPTVLVAAATLMIVDTITPKYRSEAKIAIEGRENVFLRPEAEKSIDRAAADQEAIATQVQIIQSRDIARQVIRELKLGERPEFDPALNGVSPIGAFLSAFGLGSDRLKMTQEERVMEVYFERLTVSAVERSRVITIEFLSDDPELAAKVVNAIVDAYMKLQQQAKVDQTRSASAYLANEIKQLRQTVQEADAKVDEFRAKANLYIGNNQTSLNTQQLGELTSQLATVRAQKADLDARSRAIRDMLKSGKSVELADIANSDLLKRLVEQRVLLRSQLAEQSSTLLERHPRIQELNAQINALDTQMRGELERVVNSVENDARIAAVRVEQTNEAVERIKKQISGASPQDVQLRALEREAKAQRDLLESYLARYREATARENIDSAPAEARIISRATVSNVPAFPKKLPILLVATLAALFLSAAFVISSEILRQGVPTAHAAGSHRGAEGCRAGLGRDCGAGAVGDPSLIVWAVQTQGALRPGLRAKKRHPGSRNSGACSAAGGPDRDTRQCAQRDGRGRTQHRGVRRGAQCRHHLYGARAGTRPGGEGRQGGARRSRAERAQPVHHVGRSAGAGLCRTRTRDRLVR